MHIISRKPFNDAARQFPNDREALVNTYTTLRNGRFETSSQLRQMFPTLDNFGYRDTWWVIDIGGNNLRLIAFIVWLSALSVGKTRQQSFLTLMLLLQKQIGESRC